MFYSDVDVFSVSTTTLCVVSAQIRASKGKWWKQTAEALTPTSVGKGMQYKVAFGVLETGVWDRKERKQVDFINRKYFV